jgi:hypothetical protein
MRWQWMGILFTLLLPGCYPGDPRTTEIENDTRNVIAVRFDERGFNLGRKFVVEPNTVGNLWPNDHLRDLTLLDIQEGKRIYRFTPGQLKRLQRFCPEFCTLTYKGNGRLTVRKWEGFASEPKRNFNS